MRINEIPGGSNPWGMYEPAERLPRQAGHPTPVNSGNLTYQPDPEMNDEDSIELESFSLDGGLEREDSDDDLMPVTRESADQMRARAALLQEPVIVREPVIVQAPVVVPKSQFCEHFNKPGPGR